MASSTVAICSRAILRSLGWKNKHVDGQIGNTYLEKKLQKICRSSKLQSCLHIWLLCLLSFIWHTFTRVQSRYRGQRGVLFLITLLLSSIHVIPTACSCYKEWDRGHGRQAEFIVTKESYITMWLWGYGLSMNTQGTTWQKACGHLTHKAICGDFPKLLEQSWKHTQDVKML